MKMLFTITYKKKWEDGCYCGETTTVTVYGSNIEEAREKIKKIDPCRFGVYHQILNWSAKEVLGGDVDDE